LQDDARLELGFWQIEKSSLRDFPQQFRTFEIVRNSGNTISIFTTDVDPAVKDRSLAGKSLYYAVAAQQLFNNPISFLPSGSYNVELVNYLWKYKENRGEEQVIFDHLTGIQV
jgi:hypothetical protein